MTNIIVLKSQKVWYLAALYWPGKRRKAERGQKSGEGIWCINAPTESGEHFRMVHKCTYGIW